MIYSREVFSTAEHVNYHQLHSENFAFATGSLTILFEQSFSGSRPFIYLSKNKKKDIMCFFKYLAEK